MLGNCLLHPVSIKVYIKHCSEFMCDLRQRVDIVHSPMLSVSQQYTAHSYSVYRLFGEEWT